MERSCLNEPPKPGHPDRKRALNVLAQRRYRKRIRTKLEALEGRETHATSAGQSESNFSPAQRQSHVLPTPTAFGLNATHTPDSPVPESSPLGNIKDHNPLQPRTDIDSLDSPNWGTLFDSITPEDKDPTKEPLEFIRESGALEYPSSMIASLSTTALELTSGNLALDDFIFDNAELGSEMQSLEMSQFTFPDDRSLEVPALKLMRIGTLTAEKIGCADSMWDPSASRVLSLGDFRVSDIPPNMWPTRTQTSISHHPLFDILPWPSVRDKLIFVFELPLSQRPPAARDINYIANLVYDMDDPAEGLRVIGEGSFEPEAWEIGQAFFRNWWWALDRAIVDRSNSMRAARGSPPLQITSR